MSRDKAMDSQRNARWAEIKIARIADVAMVMETPRHFTAFIARDNKVVNTGSIGVHELDHAGWELACVRHGLG